MRCHSFLYAVIAAGAFALPAMSQPDVSRKPNVLHAITEKDYHELMQRYNNDNALVVEELQKLSRQRVAAMTRNVKLEDVEELRAKHGADEQGRLRELNALYVGRQENRRRFDVPAHEWTLKEIVEELPGLLPYRDDLQKLPEHEAKHARYQFVILEDGAVERLISIDGDALNREIDRIIDEGGPLAEVYRGHRAVVAETIEKDRRESKAMVSKK